MTEMELPMQLSAYWVLVAFPLFLLKQFVCDFLLQTAWMAHGKERTENWAAPLASHVGVHAAATTTIFAVLAPSLAWLGVVDFVVHSAIDRGKGLIGRKFALTQARTPYWWLLGFDQFLHHATHVAFAMALVVFRSLH
jgi:Protein of unknown function (DUF3307)